jgi:hypothetical protein
MGPYLGDYVAGSVVYFTWDTNDGNGASVNPTVAGTISVYKDDIIVPTVAGITDTRAFNGIVGVHNVAIDTSADAFYAPGHDYHVILTASTIDTQVVNAMLAEFSIEHRQANLAQTRFQNRTNVFAAGAVAAQGITATMAARGCIQYQQVDVSYSFNFAAPDSTYYLLYHYNAQQQNDIVKPSNTTVW